MKKKPIVALFLLMAFLILGNVPVSAANEPFVWNDIELHFMGYRLSDGGPSPYLSLYVRGINNSDHRIWINVEDAKVDGAPVFSAGRTLDPYSDTGVDSPKILTFMAYDDAGEDVYEAIRNAHTIEMTIYPGESEYTGWFYMSPSWYTIDQLHWAVTRIVFDDGTIRENDDITYWDTSLH